MQYHECSLSGKGLVDFLKQLTTMCIAVPNYVKIFPIYYHVVFNSCNNNLNMTLQSNSPPKNNNNES